jgi:UDP-N-acetylmuramyl tripeptide synthase
MSRLRLIFLVWIAQLLATLSRALGRGSGTSIPGLMVEKYMPGLLRDLTKDFQEVICLSGTNGKTTTRALLVHLYESQHVRVISNRGGANIIRGLASSLLLNRDWLGRPLAKIGIFEVEEASLPIFAEYVWIHKLILTNVFRDQLDAYGEIDQTSNYFRQTIEKMGGLPRGLTDKDLKKLPKKYLQAPKRTKRDFTVYLNQDDGMLVDLLRTHSFHAVGFSVESRDLPRYEREVNTELLKLIEESFIAQKVAFKSLRTKFSIKTEGQKEVFIQSQLPGLFNVYNIIGAYVVAQERFGRTIADDVESFEPVFGRGERIELGGGAITLFLVKNPAGFDQVLQLLEENFGSEGISLTVAINDNIADGRDVSWLWDIKLEDYLEGVVINQLRTAGTRGLDMLLRFEYAGVTVDTHNYVNSFTELVKRFEKLSEDQIVLCTYTALLEIRNLLEQRVGLGGITAKGN